MESYSHTKIAQAEKFLSRPPRSVLDLQVSFWTLQFPVRPLGSGLTICSTVVFVLLCGGERPVLVLSKCRVFNRRVENVDPATSRRAGPRHGPGLPSRVSSMGRPYSYASCREGSSLNARVRRGRTRVKPAKYMAFVERFLKVCNVPRVGRIACLRIPLFQAPEMDQQNGWKTDGEQV